MLTGSNRLDAILCDAVEIDSIAERKAYLDNACGSDAELRGRVEELIALHFSAGDFLEKPAVAIAATPLTTPATEAIGTMVGPYKLREQIGEGGMGVVYVAEQLEPVRRKVALKLIKPGMDTREVIARFEAERQALALMDHPNIAKVLDAGATGVRGQGSGVRKTSQDSALIPDPRPLTPVEGRPYFVMELIRGIPITEYCDKARLTPRKRLELFVLVCQAVQHAHQKGIIHRDLKPSNVMVTLHDGVPVPKVIDFGVAKAINQQLTQETIYTQSTQMVGTPLYMSPEQAELSGLDVDTRTDVYSLGVLLYELLTGSTPFDREALRKASYDEVRRIIREEEPSKPSTLISTLGASLTTVSEQRGIDPRKLTQTVRGELDWIVMKALEKDRTRRYESASALAADVKAHLNDEPVAACPPSTTYRLRKFARRNKAALTTAAVVSAVLVLAALVSTWQAVRATGAERLALTRLDGEQQARQQAEANLVLASQATDDLFVLYGDKWDRPMRQEFSNEAALEKLLRFYEELAKQPGDEAHARQRRGKAWKRLSFIQKRLNQRDRAEKSIRQAISILEKLVHEFPEEPAYRMNLASSYLAYHFLPGLLKDDEAFLQKTIPILESLVAETPLTSRLTDRVPEGHYHGANWTDWDCGCFGQYEMVLADCHVELAYVVLQPAGRLEEAEYHYRQGANIWQTAADAFPDVAWHRWGLGNTHLWLGKLLEKTDRSEEATDHYRRAVEEHRRAAELKPTGHSGLARCYSGLGRHQEAAREWRVLVERFPDNTEAWEGLWQELGKATKTADDPSAALEEMQTAMTELGSSGPEARISLAWFLLTVPARELRDPLRAIKMAEKALSQDPSNARAVNNIAWYLLTAPDADVRSPSIAAKLAERAVELDPKAGSIWHTLGTAYVQSGKLKEARATFERYLSLEPNKARAQRETALSLLNAPNPETSDVRWAVELAKKAAESEPDNATAAHNLALFLVNCPHPEIRDPERALQLAQQAVETDRSNKGACWSVLGQARYRTGDWNGAIEALDKARELNFFRKARNGYFLAMARHKAGNAQEARRHYEEALEWMQDNHPPGAAFPQSFFRAEAEELLGISADSPVGASVNSQGRQPRETNRVMSTKP